jgi:hypothetical protein
MFSSFVVSLKILENARASAAKETALRQLSPSVRLTIFAKFSLVLGLYMFVKCFFLIVCPFKGEESV